MPGSRKAVRIAALAFALLFIFSAIVQYNDPDPFLWIILYVTAAVACLVFFVNRFTVILGLVLGVIYLAGAIWVWPEQFEGVNIGSGDIENIERGREALGLIIVSGVMFFFAWKSRSKKV